MRRVKPNKRMLLATLIGLSLVFWTLLPSATHSPTFMETLQEHAEMIADHGHSHGFIEDVFRALHWHNHDVVDHDPNQAVLVAGKSTDPLRAFGVVLVFSVSHGWPSQVFRIDRSPRI